VQLFHPKRQVLLDSRVHSIRVINTKSYSPNKLIFNSTTNKLYPFVYSEIPEEVEYSLTPCDQMTNNDSQSIDPLSVTSTLPPVISDDTSMPDPSVMMEDTNNIFNEPEQTYSLKCLQSEANPPYFVLFNDGLFIRLTKQLHFRFWPVELIWIKMDEKISDSEFELHTPEGIYKLDSALWHAVLLKTIHSVFTSRVDIHRSPSDPNNHGDSCIESNSPQDQRCCIYHVFRSGPLEGFAYYGSWLNGKLHGSGKLCWPAKSLNSLHSHQSTNSIENYGSEITFDPQNPIDNNSITNNNDNEGSLSNELIPDSVRLFLTLTGPLDICMRDIENEIVSIFCIGEFQSNQLNGLGELCIQTAQGSINIRSEWKNSRPHGIGSLRYINGDIYTGWFVNGVREGHGSQELFAVSSTQNSMKYAKRNRRPNDWNIVYLGHWQDDKQDGFGISKDITNGNVYIGQWLKNSTHGRGIMHQSSGLCVAGEFEANGINRQGLCITPEGNIYIGMLSKNQPKGKGILNILSSNLLLVGKFSGNVAIHKNNYNNSLFYNDNHNNNNRKKKNKSLHFNGDIIYTDQFFKNNSRISSGSYYYSHHHHQHYCVPILVQDRINGNWKTCDRIESVLNEMVLLNEDYKSSINLTNSSPILPDINTISSCQDYVELAILILSHTVPFHLRWDSLFQNCIIDATVLLQSMSSSSLTDCIESLSSVTLSTENPPHLVHNDDIKSVHIDNLSDHIELLDELAYWCLPSSCFDDGVGGMALNSIDELLCNSLSQLPLHKSMTSTLEDSSTIALSSPLWLKYLRIISSLLAECFQHIVCTNTNNDNNNNNENLLFFNKSPQLINVQLNNSCPQINYATHLNLVIVLTEYAHLVIRLAFTFTLAIQHRLRCESIVQSTTHSNHIVNYLFQICEPNINGDLFTTINETFNNLKKIDGQMTPAIVGVDHHPPTENEQNSIYDNNKPDSISSKQLFLCNLPEVQLSGSISLFELACDCLLPNIYSTLFEFFKAQYSLLDQSYWTYRQALHDKSDSILYSYLELD
ncbi:unnamed protein product, partial [Schistosoma turkestanicum]